MLAVAHPAGHPVHDHSSRALRHVPSPNVRAPWAENAFTGASGEDSVDTACGAIG
jgi:hypothetical protein